MQVLSYRAAAPDTNQPLRMKNFLIYSLLSLLLFCCNDDNKPADCTLAPCDPSRRTVREVADYPGRVAYDDNEDRWVIISSPEEVTYDSQNIGLVCGELPEEFRKPGLQVRFSGKFKSICEDNKALVGGHVYYYLHVTEIEED